MAITQSLSTVVDLWIEGDYEEATAIMKMVERLHKMTDKQFDEKYKEKDV